jgi:cyclase
MLAKRIIPVMLARGKKLVKGEGFNGWRNVGHVLQSAKVHAARGVDELMILDIAATKENRGPDLNVISELADGCYIPITVGGGVKTVHDIDRLLRAGADKVAICSAAWGDDIIARAADRFGCQAITVVIDYEWMTHEEEPDKSYPLIKVHNNTQIVKKPMNDGYTAIRVTEAIELMQALGAGEILLQHAQADGTLCGYDCELLEALRPLLSVPVVIAGGCSGYEDMHKAIKAGADGVAAGALYQFTDATPKGAAQYLAENGVSVRLQ